MAPAKINLTLRVMPRRPDGFHHLESLVARIDLCDEITIARRDDRQITLACNDPTIPSDESNLVRRAARLLAGKAAVSRPGVEINLKKRIPAGAGLGGGSSDAATTLMILNELWRLNMSQQELAEIGAELGSDVPLFFHSPLCIIRGRGEIVENLNRTLSGWAVLMLPKIHSSTPAVYQAFDESPPPPRPSPADILRQAESGAALMPLLYNDLEAPALSINADLADAAQCLRDLTTAPTHMTGSGSAFFTLFDERESAEACADRIKSARIPHAISTVVTALQTLA